MHGTFGWYELATLEPARAVDWYRGLLGYTQHGGGPDYLELAHGGEAFAGVTTLSADAKAMGAPPHWMGYVTVTDVVECIAKAQGLGAKLYAGPIDVPNVGRIAVLADPQGAVISIWQPQSGHPTAPQQPKAMAWNELLTTDVAAAMAFYAALFGWTPSKAVDMGPMGVYQTLSHGGQDVIGLMKMPAGMPSPAWAYYLTCSDTDAHVKAATAAGAQVMNGPMDVPGGRIANLMDPQGVMYAVFAKA